MVRNVAMTSPTYLSTSVIYGNVEARILGAGLTVCPDRRGAVDAEISVGGLPMGEVTLVAGRDGVLDTFGPTEMWADDLLESAISEMGELDASELERCIVQAVRIAASTV